MAQKILIRRGTEAQRLLLSGGSIPSLGEILYTTDNKEIFIGDGTTTGGLALNYVKSNTSLAQTIGGNLTVTGNLVVNGTTTSVNSNEVNIGDAIIVLNSLETAAPSKNSGFEIERGAADNVSILWNETANQWELTKDSDDTGTANTTTRRILDADDLTTINNRFFYKTFTTNSGSTSASSLEDSIAIVGGQSITTTGTADQISIAVTANSIGAGQLNVTGNGVAGEVLSSDGDGSFSWTPNGTSANNSTITFVGSGGITAALGDITLNQASNETITIGHLTTDGNKHIPANGTTNSGKVLTAGGTAGDYTWSNLTLGTSTVAGARKIFSDTVQSVGANAVTTTNSRTYGTQVNASGQVVVNVPWVNSGGTVTSVTAGAGMTQTGTNTINPTLNIVALDTSIIVAADSISVGVVDGGTF